MLPKLSQVSNIVVCVLYALGPYSIFSGESSFDRRKNGNCSGQKVISRYREYLKSCYENHSILHDDKLSIAPCSQFINLALVKKEEPSKNDPFSKSTFHGSVDEIVASKTPLEMDGLVTPDSRFVLVEGPPGVGKSTLCSQLCRKWDSLKSLQNYKIVLQLKLRERRVQNATELSEIFLHRDKKLCQSMVDEVLEYEGEGFCWSWMGLMKCLLL